MKIQVIHLINEVSQGGDWTHLVKLVDDQVRLGLRVAVFGRWVPLRRRQFAHDVELFQIRSPPKSPADVQCLLALRRYLAKADRCCVIHAHSIRAVLLAAVCRKRGQPIVLTRHLNAAIGRKRRFVEKHVQRRAKAVVVSSVASLRSMQKLDKSLTKRCHLLPLGVDTSQFNVSKSRRIFSRSDGDSVSWGFAGRLHPVKNVDWIIRALTVPTFRHVTLSIAGDGPLLSELMRFATDLNVLERVTFLGHLNNPASFYQSLDLLFLPSTTEQFGLTTLEGALCGVPVVQSRTGGATDYIDEDRTGCLFKPGEYQDFLRATGRAMQNLRQMQENARLDRNFLADRFDSRSYCDDLSAVYQRCFVDTASGSE